MRYRATKDGMIQFTPEEEAEFDAGIAARASEVEVKPVDQVEELIDALVKKGVLDNKDATKIKNRKM